MQFRPDVDLNPVIVDVPGAPKQVQMGSSGVTPLAHNETRVVCPKCGSPAVVKFDVDDPKYGNDVPGFVCVAGDCGYSGVAYRRPI